MLEQDVLLLDIYAKLCVASPLRFVMRHLRRGINRVAATEESHHDDLPVSPAILWYDSVAPEVSIIILNFNTSDLTRDCLRHVWNYTYGKRYEIVLVDNGSAAAEFGKLAEFAGDFHLLRLPVNRFFGEGNNIGVEASRGRYIVFLNSDALVTDGWLTPLISVLEDQPHAGGVGAKLLYPDGRVQEAGAFIDEHGTSIQCGKHYALDPAEMDKIQIVDYCSAACFALTREIFDRVSGFDPTFEPAYYEDADLCFKIASLGLFIYYCPHSVVHHIEHGTTNVWGGALGLDNVIQINRYKFLNRWRGYLSARANHRDASPTPLPPARLRAVDAAQSTDRVAVFYTPYEFVPGCGERYLLTAASALKESHRVYVAFAERYSNYRLDYMGRELSLDLSRVSVITRSELRSLPSIDVFFHLGNHAFPELPTQGRRNFYMCQFPFPISQQELTDCWENLRGYDCVLVNSNFTREVLCRRINAFQFDAKIEILAPPVPIDPLLTNQASVRTPGPPVILNIGRFFSGWHSKRHDVLIDGLRQLTEAGVDAELNLVGTLHTHPDHIRHYDDLCRRAEGLPVRFHANASPDVVRDQLSRATIYWHATGFETDPELKPESCEHFGIGVLEAMAAGCIPFVVSNGGPPEFVRDDETGFQYGTLCELIEKTRSILRDPARAAPIRERAMQEARRYAESVFIDRWRKIAKA